MFSDCPDSCHHCEILGTTKRCMSEGCHERFVLDDAEGTCHGGFNWFNKNCNNNLNEIYHINLNDELSIIFPFQHAHHIAIPVFTMASGASAPPTDATSDTPDGREMDFVMVCLVYYIICQYPKSLMQEIPAYG